MYVRATNSRARGHYFVQQKWNGSPGERFVANDTIWLPEKFRPINAIGSGLAFVLVRSPGKQRDEKRSAGRFDGSRLATVRTKYYIHRRRRPLN